MVLNKKQNIGKKCIFHKGNIWCRGHGFQKEGERLAGPIWKSPTLSRRERAPTTLGRNQDLQRETCGWRFSNYQWFKEFTQHGFRDQKRHHGILKFPIVIL